MHDVTGFAVLLLIIALLVYLTVNILLPFMFTWLFGLVSFFVFAVLILRRGRLHPTHLPNLQKPGIAFLLILMSIALPAAHGFLFGLLRHESWPWIWVLCGNALIPVAWSLRNLVRHVREKRRFLTEGHDIEQVLEAARAQDRALGVAFDRLEMAASQERPPEPWEAVAGDAAGTTMFPPGDVATLMMQISALRPGFHEIANSMLLAYEEVITGPEPKLPHPATAVARARLTELSEKASEMARLVGEVLWDRKSWG